MRHNALHMNDRACVKTKAAVAGRHCHADQQHKENAAAFLSAAVQLVAGFHASHCAV